VFAEREFGAVLDETFAQSNTFALTLRLTCLNKKPDRSQLAKKREKHLARLLADAFDSVEESIRKGMAEKGFDIEQVFLPVVRNLALDGSRISEIATRARLSKQTIGPLVRVLAERGIVEVSEDPADRRAKLVRFTQVGLLGLQAGLKSVEAVEARCSAKLGTNRLARLKRDLQIIADIAGDDDDH